MSGSPPPDPRQRHAATLISDTKMYIFGGQWDDIPKNDLFSFDLAQNTWEAVAPTSGTLPPPRSGHTLVGVGEKLVLFGGTGADGKALGDLWEFDCAAATWKKCAVGGDDVAARHSHAAVVYNDVVYVYGGQDDSGRELTDLLCYSPASGTK